MYETELEFPEGWGALKTNPFCGGRMDILWNYTMRKRAICKKLKFPFVEFF